MTRLRCSASAPRARAGSSARPVATQSPFRYTPAPRTVTARRRETASKSRRRRVDQPHAAAHELQRPGVREAAGLRLRDVDDDAHARLDQLLGRDTVEVGVVDDRDVVRARAGLTRSFVRLPSRAGPVYSTSGSSAARRGTPRRRACARAPRAAARRRGCSIRVCVGSPGTFSTRKCAVGDARDLRQVRDRDHLRALGEPPQRLGDGVRGRAADARVDLVEDDRLAARDGRDRERDPRQLAARGRLGDGRERQAGVRPDQERRPRRRPPRPASRSRSSTRNSPSPMPTPRSSSATAAANGSRGRGPRGAQLVAASVAASASAAAAPRPPRAGRAALERGELRARLGRTLEQLLVASRSGSGARVGDPVELAPRPPRAGRARPRARRGSGADRSRPRAGAARRRAARRRVRASSGASRSSGASARSARGGERRGAVAVLGSERLGRGPRALGELGDVAKPLALGAQLVLASPARGPRCPRRARAAPRAAPPRRRRRARARRAGAARRSARARRAVPRRAAAAARRRRTRRARRAGTRAARAAAARTGPDIASSRSAAAARSSRATARPQA